MANKCELDRDFKGTQCGIDARIILVWLFPILLLIVGFWALVGFTYYSDPKISILGLGSPIEVYAVLALLLLLFGIPSFIWFFLSYRAIKYTIAEDQLVMQEGVINKKRTVIPYEKIQDINVHRPLLYRLVGLALIEIETAGVSGHSPEGSIPGVANADQVVKEILTHVQVFKTPHSSRQEQDSEVHEAILSEIKALRKEMQARGYPNEPKAGVPQAKKEANSARSVIRGGKTCLPVEHAAPDRLEKKGERESKSLEDALKELRELRKQLEKK